MKDKIVGTLTIIWTILTYLYVLGFTGFGLYYNWQYANQNGFVKWVLLGEVAPTGKALIWPYSLYADRKELRERESYMAQITPILDGMSPDKEKEAAQMGAIIERKKTDEHAATLMYINTMKDYGDKSVKLLDRAKSITPPERYKVVHGLIIESLQDRIDMSAQHVDFLQRDDWHGTAVLEEQYSKINTDWADKFQKAAQDAGIAQ